MTIPRRDSPPYPFRMKFFTFPLVMAVAAVSAVVVVPFLAHPEKWKSESFALEVTMATARASYNQAIRP